MMLANLPPARLSAALRGAGLRLRTGPVVTVLRSSLEDVHEGIGLQYRHHELESDDVMADFHVCVDRPKGLRRWFQPQVEFRFDGESPFAPLPGDQGMAMLEWGLNWCISGHLHRYLMLHCAVIAHGDRAVLFPAPPGSGKSTLTAGLVGSGWRLLSDELALIEPATGHLHGLARPISLKNASIDVIRSFVPHASIGRVIHETSKGSVAHMQPPAASVADVHRPAQAAWIVLPQFRAGAPMSLEPISRAEGFMSLVQNAFNYHIHAASGFKTLTRLVDNAACYRFTYHRLQDAVERFAALAHEHQGD